MPSKPTALAKQTGTSIRIPPDLHAKLLALSERVPASSVNALGVEMIRDIISMSETPEDERTIPKTVVLMDAVKEAAPKLLRKAKEELK